MGAAQPPYVPPSYRPWDTPSCTVSPAPGVMTDHVRAVSGTEHRALVPSEGWAEEPALRRVLPGCLRERQDDARLLFLSEEKE